MPGFKQRPCLLVNTSDCSATIIDCTYGPPSGAGTREEKSARAGELREPSKSCHELPGPEQPRSETPGPGGARTPRLPGGPSGGGGGETLVTEARASAAEELLFSLRSRPGPIGGGFFLPNPKVSCCCQAT